MKRFAASTEVTLQVELYDESGVAIPDVATAPFFVDAGEAQVHSGMADIADGIATCVIPASANDLSSGATRAVRAVRIEIGSARVYDLYAIETGALSLGVIPTETGVSFADAMVVALDMQDVDDLLAAPQREQIRALRESWRRVAAIRLRAYRGDEDVSNVDERFVRGDFSLSALTFDEWSALPQRFRNACARAQVREAQSMIARDSSAEARDAGLIAKTVGDASEMFRPGKALDIGAGRFARMDGANALAASPDVCPRLGRRIAARAEIHLGGVAFRQVVRVKPGCGDRRLTTGTGA